MYKTRNIMLVAIAVLLTITTSRGINFSDFEAPTYTAGSSLDGLDGWTIAVGTGLVLGEPTEHEHMAAQVLERS